MLFQSPEAWRIDLESRSWAALVQWPGATLHHNDPAGPPELPTVSRGEADFVPTFVMAWFVVVCCSPAEIALLPNLVLVELSAAELQRRWHLSSARLLH
jgi:hypothetical protein